MTQHCMQLSAKKILHRVSTSATASRSIAYIIADVDLHKDLLKQQTLLTLASFTADQENTVLHT